MPKKKSEEKNSITCNVNEDLKIILKGVIKTYGHDDSLPFQADLYVQSKELGFPEPTKIGRAWNDGWGGDTVIDSEDFKSFIVAVNKYLTEHYQIRIKKPDISWAVRLDYLLSVMAEKNIYGKITHVDILTIEECEKVECDSKLVAPKPHKPEEEKDNSNFMASVYTLQKYRFAKCVVQTPRGTKEVIIGLASRDNLHIDEETTENIFYYCNSYNEFLELLVKAPVFTSTEDFSIKSVIKLY